MATIKSLLSTTLESFLTSKKEWVSGQSFPTGTTIEFPAVDSNNIAQLVAPADGWAEAHTVNAGSVVSLYIYGHTSKMTSFATIPNAGNKRASLFLPVSKGETIEVRNYGTGESARFHYAKSGT